MGFGFGVGGIGVAGAAAASAVAVITRTIAERILALLPAAWLPSTETYAKSKIAVDLDGTADYLNVTHADYNFGDVDFTISAWVNHDVGGAVQVIAGKWKESTNERCYQLIINASNQLEFQVSNDGTAEVLSTTTSTLSTGTWYYVEGYHDATNDIIGTKIYNTSGSLVDSDTTAHTTGINQASANNFYTGKNDDGNFLNGKLDNVVVFNSTITTTDLINSGDGLQHKDLTGSETFYNNIVAWYDFGSPSNFGREYHSPSHAVAGDGSNNIYIILDADQTGLDFQHDTSFSGGGWFYTGTLTATTTMFGKLDTGRGALHGYVYYCTTTELIFALYSGAGGTRTTKVTGSPVGNNEWVHLFFTYNHSTDTIKLYINGISQTVSNSGSAASDIDNTARFVIMRSDATGYWGGKVDEFAIYSGVLTDGEVSTIHNSGTVDSVQTLLPSPATATLVSEWRFDGQTPVSAGYDSLGVNDLTPVSIVDADLVGGKDSLDLTEVSISSSNAVLGHIEGKAAGFDGVTKNTDRSTNSNNDVQNTLANVPTFNADGSISFTGTQQLTTENAIDFSGDFTIIFRIKQSNITESSNIVTANTVIWNNNASGKDVVLGVTATNAHTNDTYTNIAIKSESGTISFRKDSIANGSGSRDATVVTSNVLTTGDGSLTQIMTVKDRFFYDRALSDSDILLHEQYLDTL